MREHYLRHVHGPSRALFAPLEARVQQNAKARAANDAAQPTSLVMKERAELQPTHYLKRGQYDQPGETVTAGVPAWLPPLPVGVPPDRLALARWLVAPDHPLTARVAVNRLWQQCFGEGLVTTPADFGTQGVGFTRLNLATSPAILTVRGLKGG